MKVLIATDGTDVSMEAARAATALFEDDIQPVLLTVIPQMPFAGDDAGGIEGPSLDPEEAAKLQWEVLLDSAERLADTAAAIAGALPDSSNLEERIGEGPPGRVICDIAREEDVDLIVVGAHDRGPLGRLFHMSVSRWVAEHADRPVLVARARPPRSA